MRIDNSLVLPEEQLEKLEAYEKEQSKIRVGDEVEFVDEDFKAVVTYICGDFVCVLYDDGSTEDVNRTEIRKTGRHFDEVEKLIEVLKGGEDSDEISF